MNDAIKQVIVMRRDLKMRRGKEIAQGSHASMAFLLDSNERTEAESQWINGIFTKICLKVDSEQDLMDIHQKALDSGLKSHIITDLGKTEFHGVPTKTCLAIGPDYSSKIDEITSELTLL